MASPGGETGLLPIASGLVEWAAFAVDRKDEGRIAVSVRCAINALLMSVLSRHLEARGASLLEARQPPPNDGGLVLGQGGVVRRIVEHTILA